MSPRTTLALALLCAISVPAAADQGEGFAARVELFSDSPERLWVVADSDGDQLPDRAFVYQSTARSLPAEVLAELPRSLPLAWISSGPGRLDVHEGAPLDSGIPSWRLEARVGPQWPAEQGSLEFDRGVAVSLTGGAALAAVRFDAQHEDRTTAVTISFDDFRDVWAPSVVVVDPGPRDDLGDGMNGCPTCASGGEGARDCRQQCSYNGNVGGSIIGGGGEIGGGVSASCSVSCGGGYHSCCNCRPRLIRFLFYPVFVAEANCVCISNNCGG